MRSLFVAPELRQAILVDGVKPPVRPRMKIENVRVILEMILLEILSKCHGGARL